MYVIYDDFYLKHDTGPYHPENPQRLVYIKRSLDDYKQIDKIKILNPTKATDEEICLVHSKEYQEKIKNISSTHSFYYLDGDTIVSRYSYDVATLAVGGCLKGIDKIIAPCKNNFKNNLINNYKSIYNNNLKIPSFFAIVRPPGHHAFKNRGSGFCIFNNIAISAIYAQQKYNIKKVAIIDFDVHHGNGTQDFFYSSDSIFYSSLHQYPHYPGSGWWNEIGSGKGEGFNLNIPIVAFSGEVDYIFAFFNLIIPIICRFSPELILVSAGFDAHFEDPLSEINLTDESFYKFAVIISYLCKKCFCGAGFVLEGGYNYSATARSVMNIIKVFAETNFLSGIETLKDLKIFLGLNMDDSFLGNVKPQNLKNFESIKKLFNV